MALREGTRVPEWLRAARAERGWSQDRAAREIGVGFSAYVKWEQGRNEPSFAMMLKIAAVYGWPSAKGRYLSLNPFIPLGPAVLTDDPAIAATG